VTKAQTIFVIALSAVALLITVFALYVLSSTRWGERWYDDPSRRPLDRRRADES